MRLVALFLVLILPVLVTGCATPHTRHGMQHYAGVPVPGGVSVSSDGYFVSSASVAQSRNPAYAERAAWARLLLEARRLNYSYYRLDPKSVQAGYDVQLTGYLNNDASDPGVQSVDSIRMLLLKPMPPKPADMAAQTALPTVNSREMAAAEPVQRQQPVDQADPESPMVIMAPDDVVTGSVKPSGPASGAAQEASAAYNPDVAATARRILGHQTTGPVTGSRIDDLASAVEQLYPSSTNGIPSGVVVRSR